MDGFTMAPGGDRQGPLLVVELRVAVQDAVDGIHDLEDEVMVTDGGGGRELLSHSP
jgi:hypothetical protein